MSLASLVLWLPQPLPLFPQLSHYLSILAAAAAPGGDGKMQNYGVGAGTRDIKIVRL